MKVVRCSQKRCSTAVHCGGGRYAAKRPTVLYNLCFQKLLPDFRQGFPAFRHPGSNKTKNSNCRHAHSQRRPQNESDSNGDLREREKLPEDCATPVLGKEEPNMSTKKVHGR